MDDSDRRFADLQPIDQMHGEDAEDTLLLQQMAADAENYLRSQKWCSAAQCRYFGGGVGKVFAVFLCRITPTERGIDPWMWVMVGDVPPAYLPFEDAASPAQAFRQYIDGMSRWVELAQGGEDLTSAEGIPPVNVPATPEWAEVLRRRLDMLLLLIEPHFEKRGQDELIN